MCVLYMILILNCFAVPQIVKRKHAMLLLEGKDKELKLDGVGQSLGQNLWTFLACLLEFNAKNV